jgi:hypothetical protein
MEYKEYESFESESERLAREKMDRQIAKAIKKLGPFCVTAIKGENIRLVFDLELIDDAITFHAIDGWMSVWSVINLLTDKNEIDAVIEEVEPKSKFHKNPAIVRKFVDGLLYWKAEGFILNQDSMAKVFDVLHERMTDNVRFLESCE